jgi:ABC-type sugar transport system permease subunit
MSSSNRGTAVKLKERRRRLIRPSRPGTPRLKNRQRETLSGLLFFLPWIIGFLAITCYPLIYSILISFNQVAIRPGEISLEPMGWEYFRQALFLDTEFPTLLVTSVTQVAIGTPISVVFALVIALLLNRSFRGRTAYRMIFFLPVIIMSGPVMSELLTETSAMSIDMDIMGLSAILMELDKGWASLLLSILNSFIRILWFCGVQIIVFLVALQKIDGSMYEAASIDGASPWEAFWKITLPHLRPIIVLNTIYTIIEMGTAADDATNTKIMESITDIARPYSFAAAMSWIYAFCLMLLMTIAFLLLRERREKGGTKR